MMSTLCQHEQVVVTTQVQKAFQALQVVPSLEDMVAMWNTIASGILEYVGRQSICGRTIPRILALTDHWAVRNMLQNLTTPYDPLIMIVIGFSAV